MAEVKEQRLPHTQTRAKPLAKPKSAALDSAAGVCAAAATNDQGRSTL